MAEDNTEQQLSNANETADPDSFFSVGSPLAAMRDGYVRRRADDLLYEAAIAGRYAHVIAPGRSGKSSLIATTSSRLEHNGVQVAVLDLEQIGIRQGETDHGRWYYSVAYRLMRQLRIRFDLQSWWQDKSILSNRQRLLEFYSEILLENVTGPVVVFVDEIQCIGRLPFGDQLLASIRAAHDARATDPDFGRLTFVLLGECDPLSLINEPALSPFNVTQAVPLDDFSRDDLNLFAPRLGLDGAQADAALDRIYYWTSGQPYLTQKLARALAREKKTTNVVDTVDRLVVQQLAGRAALHSEPHMSHIHRQIVESGGDAEAMLNIYGKLRKGIEVPADLGSAEQRRLMAVGLLEIDDAGELRIRNRIYETVFTAHWANENMPVRWRVPALALAAIVAIIAVPFWYTQWLPNVYLDSLTGAETELAVAATAWQNLRSFPGHVDTADNLYRAFLEARAEAVASEAGIEAVAARAAALPEGSLLADRLRAGYWDRRAVAALREERRDDALLASLESLVVSTPKRRRRAAMLIDDDYPLLLASTPPLAGGDYVFNPGSLLLSSTDGARVMQWSLGPDGLTRNDDWFITALEVTPLVRRIAVDRGGTVQRAGLTLNISHPRLKDLRIKVIAPSGRAVEVELDRERASSGEDLRVPREQMAPLVGESMRGTWSISVRDEATGISGHFAGWNLTLNSQGLIEDFQRGLSIPDPVERPTEQYWISADGRYAVARATRSDSARLWDLALGKPFAAIAVSESEQLIGVDDGARRLVTATLDTVHVWDTATGRRISSLQIEVGSGSPQLTADGSQLFVQYRGDDETRLERWDLQSGERRAALEIAGSPALIALDGSGSRIAVADYDRSVRIWDFERGEMLTQLDMPLQPGSIELSATGELLAAVFGQSGFAVWRLQSPEQPMLERFDPGRWQFAFSSSGARFAAGRSRSGFQLYESADGRLVGPAVGAASDPAIPGLLGFSRDEAVIVTSGPGRSVRFWDMPATSTLSLPEAGGHAIWRPSADAIVALLPDSSAMAIGDVAGHVHIVPSQVGAAPAPAPREEISFVGHNDIVRHLAASPDGRHVASVAADNTVRVWDVETALPAPFISDVPGNPVEQAVFSPDGSLLALLAGDRLSLMDVASGDLVAAIELGERHESIAFGDSGTIFAGSIDGSLNEIGRDAAGVWSARRLWQGEAAITAIAVSPHGHYIVVAGGNDVATQFSLAASEPGELSLSMPSPIEEVVFSPDGSRVLLRTARWVHRAGSSGIGLVWLDAVFVPDPLEGARLVFSEPDTPSGALGSTFFLPVARAGTVGLHEVRFSDVGARGLFGRREALLKEWRARLGRSADAGTDQGLVHSVDMP